MQIVEAIYGALLICLGAWTSYTDIKYGYIRNKILLLYLILFFGLGTVYYCIFVRDTLLEYLINVLLVAVFSLALFYTESFAGGDCKLSIVMAFGYPARLYFVNNKSIYTLYFALGFAIFWGYLFLLFSSIYGIAKGAYRLSWNKTVERFISFLKIYFITIIYISAANLCVLYIGRYTNFFEDYTWVLWAICFGLAWCVGKYNVLKKWYVFVPIVVFDITCSIIFRIIPVSLYPETYIFILVLFICRVTIAAGLYDTISVNSLRKGMILSFFSSLLMQNSNVEGLPTLSTEDLKSRLSDKEVEAVKRWASGTKTAEIVVVRKIPFAIFIFLGYLSYFLIWRLFQ